MQKKPTFYRSSGSRTLTRFAVLAALGVTVGVAGARADQGSSSGADRLTEFNRQFVAAEWKESNCEFPRMLNLSQSVLENNYQALSPGICQVNHELLSSYLGSPAFTEPETLAGPSKFPRYIKILKDQMQALPPSAAATPLLTPAQIMGTRKNFPGPSFSPNSAEAAIRKLLGVDDGHATETNCEWKRSTSGSAENEAVNRAQAHLKDLSFWQAELFNQGYDCMVSLYKAAAARLNATKGLANAQSLFDSERSSLKATPHQDIKGAPLAGLTVVVFPQLGYDIPPYPTASELLNYPTLSRGLSALGARVHVMNRVSVSSVEEQIAESAADFETLVSEEKSRGVASPRFLVTARSMGGLVAREVLERRPDLRQYVSGVILIGCTPYGSVVGDYDARGDLFDDKYLQQDTFFVNLLSWVAATPGDLILQILGFNPDFHKLDKDAEIRTNIGSMSHLNFDPTLATRAPELKVLNVTQLPDGLGTYFKDSQRSSNVDETFFEMSMYGPTEGSTPLSHAAWDTERSARVFVSDFNHLGFWSLSPDLAIDYWVSAIFTARDLGLWQ